MLFLFGWMETIRKDINGRNLNENLLPDRNKWRKIVHIIDGRDSRLVIVAFL